MWPLFKGKFMSFDNSETPAGPVYLLRLEQGPLAVSGARPFWIIGEAGLTVGRAPDCNISLTDPARIISRVQARIALIQGRVVWQQLGANPSWVNDMPLEKGAQKILNVNDVIRLDPYAFQVELRGSPVSVPAIPDDWNPLGIPVGHEAQKDLAGFPSELPGRQLSQILNAHHEKSDANQSENPELPEITLFADPPSIDELLGAGNPFSNPQNIQVEGASVWMDELHARHGFSVTTEKAIKPGPVPTPKNLSIPSDFESRFLEGLGVQTWVLEQAQRVSPELAFEMGQGFRKALDGLIALMSARTLLKNQIHAEHTTLVPKDNNPLKSCPSVDDLFLRWFASADQSYLQPERSIESSIQDLLAQQRATAMALKTVITRLAESFDPAALISKTEEAAGTWDFRKYKARWEAHVEVYHSLFGNAADPVSALLSDAFRQAFEQHSQGTKP